MITQKKQNQRAIGLNKSEKSTVSLELSGRYLVRLSDEQLESDNLLKRDTLIDLNSKKQEALTNYVNRIPIVKKINRKIFSIEGKGDLFGRYFTHFEYIVATDL